ncbi:hypothetical protein COOONC_24201 [Cooperia oncophora]
MSKALLTRSICGVQSIALREDGSGIIIESFLPGPTQYCSAPKVGRSAIHYAAAQSNAIYDTLIDLGADPRITDSDGLSAEAFRRSPDRLRRTASAESSLMMRSMSTDDEFFDPGLAFTTGTVCSSTSNSVSQRRLELVKVTLICRARLHNELKSIVL